MNIKINDFIKIETVNSEILIGTVDLITDKFIIIDDNISGDMVLVKRTEIERNSFIK